MEQVITTEAILPLLDDPGSLCLVDVRTPEEFAEWSIQGSINIPVEELESRRHEIEPGLIVLVCAAGTRAEAGVEILGRAGIDAVALKGGMAAWSQTYDVASLRFGAVTVVQLRRRGKGCLSYVIGSDASCIVIDPPMDIERVVAIAHEWGWKIASVADTHLHADHVSGARLLAETTGATLVLNDEDGYLFRADVEHRGTEIALDGSSIDVVTVATPGHTMGSTTFALGDKAVFTGDTLFLESVGRPDLADRAVEFAAALYDSLHAELLVRPDDTLVFPGHVGQDVAIHCDEVVTSTLGDLKEHLGALALDRDSFISWAAGRATPRPPNYQRIVETNRVGALLSLDDISALESGPNRCAVSAVAS